MPVELGDLVVVKNNDIVTRTLMFNSRDYIFPPGKEVFVPAEASFLWFGDPRSGGSIVTRTDPVNGTREWIPDRKTEVRRLRIRFGDNGMGAEDTFDGVISPLNFSVRTPEGEAVQTVVDDPKGLSVMEATQTVASQNELLELVQRQQRQINMLVEQIGGEEVPSLNAEEVEPPPDDAPQGYK